MVNSEKTEPPTPPPTPALSDESPSAHDGAPAAASADAKEAAEAVEEEEPPFLEDLVILPARQKSGTASSSLGGQLSGIVHLPPIRSEEPVASLRAALGEVKGYAHLTCYRLVLEGRPDGLDEAERRDREKKAAKKAKGVQQQAALASSQGNQGQQQGGGGKGKKSKKKKGKGGSSGGGAKPSVAASPSDVVSPFTGPDAVVAVPSTVRSLEVDPATYTPLLGADASDPNAPRPVATVLPDGEVVLDDYGDLAPLLERGLVNGSAFRVVLERYDAAGIKDHVARVRAVLDGGAPAVEDLHEAPPLESKEEVKAAESDDKENSDAADATEIVAAETAAAEGDGKQKAAETEAGKKKKNPMPHFPLDRPVAVDASDLSDFYYLACGEEEALEEIRSGAGNKTSAAAAKRSSDSSDDEAKKDGTAAADEGEDESFVTLRDTAARLNDLDRRCRVDCTVRFGGFHPPPPHRRLLGDMAYLEVTVGGGGAGAANGEFAGGETIHVTCVPAGFYVNRTRPAPTGGGGAPFVFDPTPAHDPCFSHELLDCLLRRSGALRTAWADAVASSRERADVQAMASSGDSPLRALFRVAVRGDVAGGEGARGLDRATGASAADGLDAVVLRPSWVLPLPRAGSNGKSTSNTAVVGPPHEYNAVRAEEDAASTFGLDVRAGSARDWNEELQSAREMARGGIQERIERARMVHKVLTDFGEAAVIGSRAIYTGHVTPMNPNEPTRSHVYLHNNIFFSRAVDAGVDTFKICQGDHAARKSAARDAHCMGQLHRLDLDGLHTLATVLVDYLGTRLVCQSIVPGILHGERTHTLLYGAVEATQPLSWDKDMHEVLEESLGKGMMVATRKFPRMPLSDERVEAIRRLRPYPPLPEPATEESKAATAAASDGVEGADKSGDKKEDDATTLNTVCGPIEAKGIKGSDQRKYLLDLMRLTPRDANWVPQAEGGTGKWEAVLADKSAKTGAAPNGKAKKRSLVPASLDDDEFVMAVLRPELVTAMTHSKMKEWMAAKKKKAEEKNAPDSDSKEEGEDGETTSPSKKEEEGKATDSDLKSSIDPDDEAHLISLRFNVNVFVPHAKSLQGLDDEAYQQHLQDEETVRKASAHLWDEVVPSVSKEIRETGGSNLPVDGRALTEMLHTRGVNCRYLGRLAQLAAAEEALDVKAEEDLGKDAVLAAGTNPSETKDAASAPTKNLMLPRRIMPHCWLELLETEMVARAAKHVLDGYLTEGGGAAAVAPAQTIASFLSALVSVGEESAADTETRVSKKQSGSSASALDDEAANSLALFEVGGGGDSVASPVRGRAEVWDDIESEVGRRFRYVLHFYNLGINPTGKAKIQASRALFIPLLRRVCQRTGVRLAGRKYETGAKCLCASSTGRTIASYPITPLDILEVVPLVKHAASLAGESFVPVSRDGTAGMPSLFILLPDAKATFEAAHAHWNAKVLPQALDLTHEASALYQRVVDTPLHASVARCFDLIAAILFHAREPDMAAANAARALAVNVQLGGFDCHEAVNGHATLSHILVAQAGSSTNGAVAKTERGMKHLRASLYLMELLGGPRHAEISSTYHKIGSMYHEVGSAINALRFYQEASTRAVSDRLVEGMIAKSTAYVLAAIGQFKSALETEKRAYGIYRLTLGEKHDLTVNSAASLKQFMKLAVEQGTRAKVADKKKREEQAADAVASQIEADEVAEEERKSRKKKSKKKKKGKN